MPPYEQPQANPLGAPPFASWGSRALAYILDGLIVAVVPVVIYIVLIASDQQVFLHIERREESAALRHHGDPESQDSVGPFASDRLAMPAC